MLYQQKTISIKTNIRTLLIASLIFSTLLVKAQDITFGSRIGLPITNIYGDDVNNTDARLGFELAGVAIIDFGGWFALQPELSFITRGYKLETFGEDVKISANYIDLNALARAQFAISRGLDFHGLIGPVIGFGIGDVRQKIDNDTIKFEFDDAGVNRGDFGLLFGAGIDFDLAGFETFTDLRYHIGINDILEGTSEARHNAFIITVGVLLFD